MIKKNETIKINEMLETNSHKWDNQIAFSLKDIHEMLDIPLSTIQYLCKEGHIKVFKVGRHYRVTRVDLFRYIEGQKDKCIIL